MKLVATLLLVITPIAVNAQKIEIGAGLGTAPHTSPKHESPGGKVDLFSDSKAVPNFAGHIQGLYNFRVLQVGLRLELVNIKYKADGYEYYIATPMIPIVAIINANYKSFYGGLSGGAALINEESKVNGNSISFGGSTGFTAGAQIGYTKWFKRIGANIEAAGRYVSYESGLAVTDDNGVYLYNAKFQYFYFPLTLGVRYKF